MTYSLHRASETADGAMPTVQLGDYASFEEALTARDTDAISQLRAAGGQRITVRHLIVGPGPAGPATAHPVTTCFGAAGTRPATDAPASIEAAERWLRTIRQAGARPTADPR